MTEHNKDETIEVGDLVRVVNPCSASIGLEYEFVVRGFSGEYVESDPDPDSGEYFWYPRELEIMEPAESRQMREVMEDEEEYQKRKDEAYLWLLDKRDECLDTGNVLIADLDELEALLGPSEGNL